MDAGEKPPTADAQSSGSRRNKPKTQPAPGAFGEICAASRRKPRSAMAEPPRFKHARRAARRRVAFRARSTSTGSDTIRARQRKRQADQILLGGDQRAPGRARLAGERRRARLAIAMMVGERRGGATRRAPSILERREEFLRAARCRRRRRTRAPARSSASAGASRARSTGLPAETAGEAGRVLAHQHHGVGAREPARDRLAQRSGRHTRGRCRSRSRRRSPAATDPWRAQGSATRHPSGSPARPPRPPRARRRRGRARSSTAPPSPAATARRRPRAASWRAGIDRERTARAVRHSRGSGCGP